MLARCTVHIPGTVALVHASNPSRVNEDTQKGVAAELVNTLRCKAKTPCENLVQNIAAELSGFFGQFATRLALRVKCPIWDILPAELIVL